MYFNENKKLNTSIQSQKIHKEHKYTSTKNKSMSKDIHIIIRSLMVKVVKFDKEYRSNSDK